MDIATGDILAMVSTPTFTRERLFGDPESVLEDELNKPLINRACGAPYPPGSIVKALVLPEAVKRGVVPADVEIECTGHLLPNKPLSYRCWVYKRYGRTHAGEFGGPIPCAQAIKVSCNIYFYTLGRMMGEGGMRAVYQDFGVGPVLPGETEGIASLPLDGVFTGTIGRGRPGTVDGAIDENDATFMAMGQGPISWTPLHAANSYAVLARGGTALGPTLVADDEPARGVERGLDREAVRASLAGLDLVTNDPRGTGHALFLPTGVEDLFTAPGVRVRGKTGTAAAPPITVDGRVVRTGDHAWFAAIVGAEGVRTPGTVVDGAAYAIAVIMEYGGSGGRVSGPIVNQIVHALIDEGYLPDRRDAQASGTASRGPGWGDR